MNKIQKMLSGERQDPNLVTNPSDDVVSADVDSSPKYFVIFAALGFGGTVLFSYELALLNTFTGLYELIVVAATALVLMIMIIFQTMMIKSKKLSLILAGIEAVGLLTFFLGRFSVFHFFAGLIFVTLVFIGFLQAQKIIDHSLKFRFYTISGTVLRYSLLGFTLFLSLLYAGIYHAGGGLSIELYDLALKGSTPVVRSIVPNFAPTMTVDGFFEEFVDARLEGYQQLQDLSESERQETTRELANDIRNQLLKDADPAAENETVARYSYRLLADQFNKLNEQGLGIFVVVAIAALLFFPIRLTLLILKWPVLLVARAIFGLLEGFGVVHLLNEKRNKELLVVK